MAFALVPERLPVRGPYAVPVMHRVFRVNRKNVPHFLPGIGCSGCDRRVDLLPSGEIRFRHEDRGLILRLAVVVRVRVRLIEVYIRKPDVG